MSLSNNLYQLAQSMNQGEKRHFNLYASLHKSSKDKSYLRLFEAFSSKQPHDEKKLQQDAGITKNYSQQKRYLYNLIWKSLHDYHNNNSISIQIRNLINQAELSYQKGLYQIALESIRQAKKIAEENEETELLIDIGRREIRIIYKIEGGVGRKIIDNILQKETDTLDQMLELNSIRKTSVRINNFLAIKGKPRNAEEQQVFIKEIGDTPIFNQQFNPKKPLRVNSAIIAQRYLLRIGKDNSETCIKEAKQILALLDEKPLLSENDILIYNLHLNHYIILCLESENFIDALSGLEKVKNLKYNSKPRKINAIQFYYSNKLALLVYMADIKNAGNFAKEAEEMLEEYQDDLIPLYQIIIEYSLIQTYILSEDYSRALFWCNKILESKSTIREDIYNLTKILFLIIHLEKKNVFLVSSYLKNTYKYLTKKDRLYEIEKEVLVCIKAACNTDNEKNAIPFYKALKTNLIPLYENAAKKKADIGFDFLSWAESKIENKSFAEVIIEKSLK